MLPQLTVYAKILYLLMVVISGALCKDVVLMTQCPRSKTIHIDIKGKVSITAEAPTAQNITLGGYIEFVNGSNSLKTTLFFKERQMYLCFNEKWKLVGEKKLHEGCYFTESDKHGFYEYSSYRNSMRKIQFLRKAHNKTCSHFSKIASDIYHVDNGHNLSISPDTSNKNSLSNTNGRISHPRRHKHGSRRRTHQHSKELTALTGAGTSTIGEQHPKRTRNNGNRRKKLRTTKHRCLHQHAGVDASKDLPPCRSIGHSAVVSSKSSSSSFSNVHDEYSNDDASAIVESPLKNSSTESPQNPNARKYLSRSSSGSNSNSYDHTNRKRITSSSLSSINANFDRDNKYNNNNKDGGGIDRDDDDNVDIDNDSNSSSSLTGSSRARPLHSRTKKYYNNKLISSLYPGPPISTGIASSASAAASSLQSTIVGGDPNYNRKDIAAHFKSPAVITPDKLKKVRSRHRKKFQQRTS